MATAPHRRVVAQGATAATSGSWSLPRAAGQLTARFPMSASSARLTAGAVEGADLSCSRSSRADARRGRWWRIRRCRRDDHRRGCSHRIAVALVGGCTRTRDAQHRRWSAGIAGAFAAAGVDRGRACAQAARRLEAVGAVVWVERGALLDVADRHSRASHSRQGTARRAFRDLPEALEDAAANFGFGDADARRLSRIATLRRRGQASRGGGWTSCSATLRAQGDLRAGGTR